MWKCARTIVIAGATAFGLAACSDAPPPAPLSSSSPQDQAQGETEARAVAATGTATRQAKRRPAQVRQREQTGNRPPVVRNVSIVPDEEAAAESSNWLALVVADDPEGDALELEYLWLVNGEPTSNTSDRFDPRQHRRGDRVQLEVRVRDNWNNESAAARTGTIEISNAAPDITSSPPARMAGGLYRYRVEARDPEGDAPLRYELLQSPDGMRIDPYTGELQWRPVASQTGTHTIEIAVTDNRGSQSVQLFDLPITPPGA